MKKARSVAKKSSAKKKITKPARRAAARAVTLLIGTRKGAFVLRGDGGRKKWKLTGPEFLGCVVNHVVADPREPRRWVMAVKTGHLGPTVFRSADGGKKWTEAEKPPAFAKAPEGQDGRTVDSTFWLTPGHATQPGTWYAGTIPHGLFRSDDHGATWAEVAGFNDWLMAQPWSVKGKDGGSPEGPITHSILVDPRDGAHLYIGLSSGGCFESTDTGATWRPLNRGVAADFLPDKDPLVGHDPHCIAYHPLHPDRLYQQNHCGIYRLDRPGEVWQRIGKAMPKAIGDIGFGIVLHPRDPDTAWVLPMDGTTVWPRTSPGGKPSVYRTSDGGVSWQRQDRGLPAQGWLTVKRQSFCADQGDPVGLYFGTTSGEVWASADEGRSWTQIAAHLPHIYSVVVAEG